VPDSLPSEREHVLAELCQAEFDTVPRPALLALCECLAAPELVIQVVVQSTAVKFVNLPEGLAAELCDDLFSGHPSLELLHTFLNCRSGMSHVIGAARVRAATPLQPLELNRISAPAPDSVLFVTFLGLSRNNFNNGNQHARLLFKWFKYLEQQQGMPAMLKVLFVRSDQPLSLLRIYQGASCERDTSAEWLARVEPHFGRLRSREFEVACGVVRPPASMCGWFLVSWHSKSRAREYTKQARRYLMSIGAFPFVLKFVCNES